MNRETLLKLKNNPFYKLSAKHQAELDALEGNDSKMIAFGDPTLHNQYFPEHQTKIVRTGRKCK